MAGSEHQENPLTRLVSAEQTRKLVNCSVSKNQSTGKSKAGASCLFGYSW